MLVGLYTDISFLVFFCSKLKIDSKLIIINIHDMSICCGAASTDLSALEVSPGVLLRVTTCTGDKLFSQAAMNLDPVGTAGHLVSMVVADGTANAPTALLANHMESSLAAAVAKEGKKVMGNLIS